MTPTRLRDLVLLAAGTSVLAYLAAAPLHRAALPTYVALPLLMLAVAELVLARVVRERLARRPGRPGARALDPLQIARAAVVAKASSAGGALLLGAYTGLLLWTAPRRAELLTAGRASTVAAVAALACLGLVAAGLRLERSCRTPPQDVPGTGSPGAA